MLKRKKDREYDLQHAKNADQAEYLYLREMKKLGTPAKATPGRVLINRVGPGNVMDSENTGALRVLLSECINAINRCEHEVHTANITIGYTPANNDSYVRAEWSIGEKKT